MLGKAGTVLQGVKRITAVYGLDMDKTLASVKAETLSQEGDDAKVRVSFSLFDQPLSFETEMTRKDGHWYGKKSLEEMAETMGGDAESDMDEMESSEDDMEQMDESDSDQ